MTYVGHSTLLIQTHGLNILTDPIWSNRCSPVRWVGPRRFKEAGLSFDLLPKIDLILVSHNHYDHLDIKTLKKLWKRDNPYVITPLGNDTIIRKYNKHIHAVSMDWFETIAVDDIALIHLAPAQHWSGRGLLDRNKALWGAFIIETPSGNIYFAGDTGYGNGEHFRQTFQKYGPFKLAFLPIGATEPRWFMKYSHMNAEDAALAHLDLGKPYTLGIHFGTFRLTDESHVDPIIHLEKARKKFKIPKNRFKTLHEGEIWRVPS